LVTSGGDTKVASENSRIEKYQYEVRTRLRDGVVESVALLYLYAEQHEFLAVVAFVSDDHELEKPELSPNGQVTAELHLHQQAPIIDMLRNEKPVYFSWSADRQEISLSTAEEPVGEQELRRLFSWMYI